MTEAADSLARLRRWSDLWRHPSLFRLVHGSQEKPSERMLLLAMLEGDAPDKQTAWRAIAAGNDVAATQAAYNQVATELGVSSADKVMVESRRDFARRVELVRATARALSSGGSAIENELKAATENLTHDPLFAEQTLRKSTENALALEQRDLDALAQKYLAKGDADPQLDRFRQAIAAGDLRLAQIYASQLGYQVPASVQFVQDSRLERVPTVRLLKWRLDAAGSPAWLTKLELADSEVVFLSNVLAILEQGSVDLDKAEQFLRSALWFLEGDQGRTASLVREDNTDENIWMFKLRAPSALSLFPHAASKDGSVRLVVPRNQGARFPVMRDEIRFVAWDIFECWRLDAKPDSIIATPRILLELLPQRTGRIRAFVGLQSRLVSVRPLILQVLNLDPDRCLWLAGSTAQSGANNRSGGSMLGALIQGLDLFVDEDDLQALRDACGDRLSFLLLTLRVIAEAMDNAPASDRRFDALNMILRRDVESSLEAALKRELQSLLQDRWTEIAIRLDIADDELERRTSASESELTVQEVANALFREGCAGSHEEAKQQVFELLDLGLLRNAGASNAPFPEPRIRHGLPLPSRILLR